MQFILQAPKSTTSFGTSTQEQLEKVSAVEFTFLKGLSNEENKK